MSKARGQGTGELLGGDPDRAPLLRTLGPSHEGVGSGEWKAFWVEGFLASPTPGPAPSSQPSCFIWFLRFSFTR